MILNAVTFLKNNWGVVLILGIFVFWGGFLRLHNLGVQSLWIDEGYTINATQGILDHGYPILDSGATYPVHILHNYFTALSIKLFGFDAYNPWSARLPAALFGIFSILAVYFFTFRVTKNKLTALTASFIIAFSYWEISWSRQARGYTDMQFFIIMAFMFFYDWLDTKKISTAIWTVVFFTLSYLSHAVALIFIPSFFLIFFIHGIVNNKIREWLSPTTISLFVILGGIGVWIAMRILPKITLYDYAGKYASFLLGDFKYISLAVATIIIGLFLFKNRFWRALYLVMTVIPPLLIIFFYSQTIQMRYLLPVFPFLIIIACYSIYLLAIKTPYAKEKYQLFFFCSIVAVMSIPIVTFIPKTIYNLEIGSPQPNFKIGYSAIRTLQKDDDVVISPYTQLSKIYLKDRGLWLPISLNGRSDEITNNNINGGDYYTGAPIIPDKTALEKILNTQHGYIVIDSMSKKRLKDTFTYIINHPRVIPVYYEKSTTNDVIAVYGFGL